MVRLTSDVSVPTALRESLERWLNGRFAAEAEIARGKINERVWFDAGASSGRVAAVFFDPSDASDLFCYDVLVPKVGTVRLPDRDISFETQVKPGDIVRGADGRPIGIATAAAPDSAGSYIPATTRAPTIRLLTKGSAWSTRPATPTPTSATAS